MSASNNFQPRWLKLKQAALCYAIGRDKLKRLALAGEIVGFSDPDSKRGDWIFKSDSLDAYREAQASELELKAAALYRKAAG